jgi:hypothetical protein
MKTVTEVRQAFWESFPEFHSEYRTKKRQNEYNAIIRTYFVDFVDMLARDRVISDKLANRVTL